MQAKLNQIAYKARQDKKLRFTSLIHHINHHTLAKCFHELKANKASGIDNISVAQYGANLGHNISKLMDKLKSGSYKPLPVRRVFIPKANKKEKRPLGIPSVEDKIVQLAIKKILEPIFEQDFLDLSYGFRAKRNCHDAIKALDHSVMKKPTNYIVEVDIKGFFDNVNHHKLLKCLEVRINEPKMIKLIKSFLKAGVMIDGNEYDTPVGTPQGGIISPLLANIYLHYILDLWFEVKIKPKSKGHMELIRYCDDFVVCCESKKDAEDFLEILRLRLADFNLQVAEEKTKILKFGRKPWHLANKNNQKLETFDFLGFTHYCGKTKQGYFSMQHKTCKKKLSSSLKGISKWLKDIRSCINLKDWRPVLKAKLIGHYNYFGVSGNFRCLMQFYKAVFSMLFKWINRRSQKKSMNFERYIQYLQYNPLPQPRITYALY